MASLGMSKAHPLKKKEIDARVSNKIGNYALGYIKDKRFVVMYIGRSDDELNARLKTWIGGYPRFKFSYGKTRLKAWKKECRNFHDFGGTQLLDNNIHPARPAGYTKKENPCFKRGCKD